MPDLPENMILRTLYLPRELDQSLKAAALRAGRSKGELLREMIQAGLAARASSEKASGSTSPVSVKPVRGRMINKTSRKDAKAKKSGIRKVLVGA